MEDRCVCCGEIVPEGRMVCPQCERNMRTEDTVKRSVQKNSERYVKQ